MSHLTINSLTKHFQSSNNATTAFQNISLTIEQGEFVAIVGPSGCGKTSLLRVIAGLEQASEGNFAIAPGKDHVAMVFQEHGLFPWMSLKDNLQVVLRNQKALNVEEKGK